MQTYSLVEHIKNRGYTTIPEIIVPSRDLLNIKELINQKCNTTIVPNRKSLKYVLSRSREFIDSHFKIQDVPYYHATSIGPVKIEKYGTIHPYGLPITCIREKNSFYGCLRELVAINSNKKTNEYYCVIKLSKKNTELTSLAYTHEITHTQLNHIKGLIEDYSNVEFLSIFLETVQAYETSDKLLRIHDLARLGDLSDIIEDLQEYYPTTDKDIEDMLVEGSIYATSTLKAYNLFIRYYNSSLSQKKEILNDIQKIFYHEMSVEDLLSKYNITFENSENVKSLKNYLRR